MNPQEMIREKVRSLLESNEIDRAIGFVRKESGRIGIGIIDDPKDTDKLVWNPLCDVNLARYVRSINEGRTAVLLKGCDSRAIVQLMKANQIDREKFFFIGLPCRGIVDRDRLENLPRSASWSEDGIILVSDDGESVIMSEEGLLEACRACRHPNPVIYDLIVEEPVTPREFDPYEEIRAIEAMSADERWEYFKREFESCIRCYACRNACPVCFCKQCFVDSVQPRWLSKSAEVKENITFHLIRMIHLAGRCVGCGACERACPMDIRLRLLTRKIEEIADKMFDYVSGMDVEEIDLLSTFAPDDPDDFIL